MCIYLFIAICPNDIDAQINMDFYFDSIVKYSDSSEISSNGDCGYYIYDILRYNKIALYNKDFSVYKIIEIVPPEGFVGNTNYDKYNITFASKHLFNLDDKIEILIRFTSKSWASINNQKMFLYNEDGEVLMDFGAAFNIEPHVYTVGENHDCLFLIKQTAYYPVNFKTEVYSLRGAITSINNIKNEKNGLNPNPNPAGTYVNLPYNIITLNQNPYLKIFDARGRLVEQKKLDNQSTNIVINVSSYQDGIYIYNMNGISNKFIVRH